MIEEPRAYFTLNYTTLVWMTVETPCCGVAFCEVRAKAGETGQFQENEFAPCKARGQHNIQNTKQAMYYKKIEARSCNHYCRRQAKSVIYSECVFVALGILHAIRMSYLRPVRLYITFPQYIINGKIFEKKVIEYKMRVHSLKFA